MPSPQNQDRKVILVFNFVTGPMVNLISLKSIADEGRKKSFTIDHPITKKKIKLIFYSIHPDFKHGKMVYNFVEEVNEDCD